MIRRCCCLMLVVIFCLPGCGGEQPFRKATSPVKGKITVDGQPPGSGIQIACHPVAGFDSTHPTVTSGESDAEGNFVLSTYESGDGLPAGDYVLLFTWQEFNLMTRSYAGADKLKGKYATAEISPFKISVKEGAENDMGAIELTTK